MTQSEYRVDVYGEGSTHDFLLMGGPIDNSEAHAELFSAIGLAASAWARLEQHLDAVLVHVNKATSQELYNPTHPTSFSSKVRLLKRWFNNHRELSGLAEDMRQLTSSVKKLSLHRNLHLHSILEAWNPDTRMITFNSIQYKGNDEFTCRRVEVPIEAILSFTRLTNISNKYLSTISRVLFSPGALSSIRRP